jgi:predicted chitinase
MKKLIINESEKKEIRSLYNLSEQEDNFVTRMIKAALDGVEGKLKSSSTSSSDDKLSTDSVTNDSKPTGDTGKIELTGNFDSEQKKNIELMVDYMNKSNIKDPITQIGLLSVISKESNFKPKSEVSYSNTANSRIRNIFGSRVSKFSDSELSSLKQDPEKFFNVVYAKTVGNQGGGDGWKYRGRGFNQLTGKKNYEKYGNMIGKNLVGNPELVNDPKIAAEIAVVFFTKGKSGNSFPKFNDKTESSSYFADINSGGGRSSHRSNAIAASNKFDVKDIT